MGYAAVTFEVRHLVWQAGISLAVNVLRGCPALFPFRFCFQSSPLALTRFIFLLPFPSASSVPD
jgi:hypothetical protein